MRGHADRQSQFRIYYIGIDVSPSISGPISIFNTIASIDLF